MIGFFGVSYRLVALAETILAALASLFAPKFASHYAQQNPVALMRELRISQLYSFVAYLPFFLVFTLMSEPVLNLFGPGFKDAHTVLWIMAIGQLFNSATGLPGHLLNMVGKEVWGLWITVLSVGIMTILTVVLGSISGIVGVAWGYAIVVSGRNLISYILARRTIKLMQIPYARAN
jgi:O-antigen/teichoic acid export membrane protein